MNQEHNNPNEQQANSTPDQPVNEWFNQVEAPISTTPTPKQLKRHVRIIIMASIALLVAGGAIAAYIAYRSLATKEVSTSCFKATPYQSLLPLIATVNDDSLSIQDVKPQKLLYTHYVHFTPNTAAIDTGLSPEASEFLRSLGTYDTAHHANAPLAVHLGANYASTDNISTVKAQITKVRDILVDAGFTKDYIVIDTPQRVVPDQETAFQDSNIVAVRIAPSVICSEEK